MTPDVLEPLPSTQIGPARILVDANVFARREWMTPLLVAARDGHLVLFWSPAIIAEASRVLLWLWLQKRGGRMADALKREAFDVARRWFRHMTAAFRVVEDCPPYASQWTDTPRDEDDHPIWTAAVRAEVIVVVTENLRDGPPVDADGFQTWNGIIYLHPDRFIGLLDRWASVIGTGQIPSEQAEVASSAPGDVSIDREFSAQLLDLLRTVESRARTELPPDPASD